MLTAKEIIKREKKEFKWLIISLILGISNIFLYGHVRPLILVCIAAGTLVIVVDTIIMIRENK